MAHEARSASLLLLGFLLHAHAKLFCPRNKRVLHDLPQLPAGLRRPSTFFAKTTGRDVSVGGGAGRSALRLALSILRKSMFSVLVPYHASSFASACADARWLSPKPTSARQKICASLAALWH